MILRSFAIAIITILFFNELKAQQDLGTSFLRNTWQINYTNPARTPQGMKVAISLPGLYGNVSTPLSYNQLITKTVTGNLLDVDNALTKLGKNNRVFVNAHVHTFNLAINIKNLTFNIGHAVRSDFGLKFPKELTELAWQGNAAFLGENLEIAPHIQFNIYNEYSAGASYKMDKLTVGGKMKILAGIATVNSKNSSILLNTDDDIYQLNFDGNYTIQTAGVFEIDAEDGITVNTDMLEKNRFFSQNIGVGFDFGASYQMNDKLTLSASILDIGGIRWKDIPNIFEAKGEARFEGINLISYTQDFSLSFEEKKDSILNLFNISQEKKGFFSGLPTRAYLNADYELNQWITVGGLVYFEDYQRNLNVAFSGNATLHLGKILDIGASYSIKSNAYANIGLSSVLNLGPIQFFAMTDNILAVFTPETQRSTNVRTGLNLIFRERKEREEKTKTKKNSYYKNVPPVDCPNIKSKKRKRS